MGQPNHRVRVAALRREKMRSRLLEAALTVFAQAEDEAAAVDEIILRADVSRGTFYNYFNNADDLLRAVADDIGTELMQAVAPVVEARDDPAERVSAGVRSWISLIGRYPGLAVFFRRAGLYILSNKQVRTDLSRDLVAGMKSRRFTIDELELGFVLVAGTVLAAINTMAIGRAPRTYGNRLAERILLSLGVEPSEAGKIAGGRLEKPQLTSESLIARSFNSAPIRE
jgi:AcrR family transcriptional regulator